MTTSLTVRNPQQIKPSNINSMLDQFAASLDLKVRSQELAATTALGYVRGARRFVEWSTVNRKGAGLSDTIREWKADMIDGGYAAGSICAWLAGVRALFAWATETGITPYNPASAIRGASRKGTNKRHAKESLTDNESRRLLALPDTSTIQGKRDAAIISIMLHTACRTVELHRANIEDIKTRGGRLVIYVQGKGYHVKDDFLLIGNAENALQDWLAVRDPKATALFHSLSNRSHSGRLSLPSFRALVMDYMRLAGVQGNKTTHSLRHTAITKAVSSGLPLQKISKDLARHSNIDTTLIYYHDLDRFADPVEDHISY